MTALTALSPPKRTEAEAREQRARADADDKRWNELTEAIGMGLILLDELRDARSTLTNVGLSGRFLAAAKASHEQLGKRIAALVGEGQ